VAPRKKQIGFQRRSHFVCILAAKKTHEENIMSTECKSCAFYEDHVVNSGREANGAGLCRYNPPIQQPEEDKRGLWPVVEANDWCGHYSTEFRA